LHRILRQPIGVLVDTPVTPDMLIALRLATESIQNRGVLLGLV